MIRESRQGQRPRRIRFSPPDPVTGRRYPIPAGGATDDEDDTKGENEDEPKEEEDDQTGSEEEDKDSKGKSSEATVSRAEYEKLVNRMKAADRRATEAENKVQEYEDQDKSDLEKAQRDLKEATNSIETLSSENGDLKVRLAVLTAPEASKFYDLEDVLLRVDLESFVDDDGNIDSKKVSAALKDLAESKKHLVRESEEEEEEEGSKGPPATGRPKNKKKKSDGLDRSALEKKYPALRR